MNKKIPFEPEHLLMLADVEGRLSATALAEGKIHKKAGPTATILMDGEVAACGGIHTIWAGTGEAWLVVSKRHLAPSLFRGIRVCLEEWMVDYTRIQAVTTTGWREGERTLAFLGFRFEAVLRKFGPGGVDKSLYARIR